MSSNRIYSDEVLGRRCLILYQEEDGTKTPFAGKVTAYQAAFTNDTNADIERLHRITFDDDGTTQWLDLAEQKAADLLWWDDSKNQDNNIQDQKPAAKSQAAKKPASHQPSTGHQPSVADLFPKINAPQQVTQDEVVDLQEEEETDDEEEYQQETEVEEEEQKDCSYTNKETKGSSSFTCSRHPNPAEQRLD